MKYSLYIVFFALAFLGSACQDFLDVNADPNNPQAIPLESRLVGAITMSNGASMWRAAREIAAVCQYASAPTATNAAETWRFTASNFFWQNAYTWAIPNCVDMVVQGKAEGSPHFAGAGRTLEALNFGMLTDQYGSIPRPGGLRRGHYRTPLACLRQAGRCVQTDYRKVGRGDRSFQRSEQQEKSEPG